MSHYTDYTPDLSSLNDLPEVTTIPKPDAEQKSRAQGHRVRTQRRAKDPGRSGSNKPQPEPKSGEKPKAEGPSLWSRIITAVTGPGVRVLWGIFLGCIGVYMLVAFISYFANCIHDQSIINSLPIGQAVPVKNASGEGGARLAEFLINESFGLGSLVVVTWFLAMSLKMLIGRPRFKSVNFTIKCIIALITVSLIVGLITIGTHSPVNWGGYHGRYVNEFIVNFTGWTGGVLLSIFMLSVFVVICLRDVVMWIIRLRRKHMERRRAAAQARAEEEARQAAIARMKQQEQVDDMKAGETSVINADSVSEIKDGDSHVEFSGSDSLYCVPDTELEQELQSESGDSIESGEKNDDITEPVTEAESESVTVPEAVAVPSSEVINYRAPEVEANEDSKDKQQEDAADEESAERETDNVEESNDQSQEEDKGSEEHNAGADSTTSDTATTPEGKPKMRVNVNSIGEATKKNFQSQVDIFRAQNYKFPPIDILIPGKERPAIDPEEQLKNQNKIERILLNFNIPINRIEATIGPTVTLYEVVPEQGVKISKIRNLTGEIAMNLAANGVRVIAPIPGKGTVGIEVANKERQTVMMRTIVNSKRFQETKCKLPLALGSTISNDVYIADLTKMPHLLVAGATGQGKSAGLNAIVASLLYCKAPWQLKFVMIDPKQVEFSLYNKLRDHYMAMIPEDAQDPDSEPVLTDMNKVEATLNALCIEMENRYSLLKAAHTRNIDEYNAKISEASLNPKDGHKYLPYIVVIVDEFADLIMMKGKAVEIPVARLAQKARAVGMHVIIATQRPSVNVITGMIKANFPARISFRVLSGVDSKTILDATGADQLIGCGDMLVFNNSEMVRVQGAFISTPEVEDLCDYVSRQPYPTGPYILPEPQLDGASDSSKGGDVAITDRDPLFEEIARVVVQSNYASTSALQRDYKLGYNRAGRIMDQLARANIVGPSQGGKPRAVLVDMVGLENILSQLG